MANLRIEHKTQKTKQEIWSWIDTNIEKGLESKVPKEKFKVTPVPAENIFKLKGEHVSAEIKVLEGAVDCNITIPLLFTPLKSVIESGVRSVLKDL